MERAVAYLRDVVGDFEHPVLGSIVGKGGRAEIDQHVPWAVGVDEAQQERVAEADLMAAMRIPEKRTNCA